MAAKFEKPAAGLPPWEWVEIGLPSAQEKINAHPELTSKPAAGFNALKWAELGLQSAQEKVYEVMK